jgi:anti-sigma regulatory factor (Ser/Thr protein kinase)
MPLPGPAGADDEGGAGAAAGSLRHMALFYSDQAECRTELAALVRASMAGGRPSFVALPGDGARLLAAQFDGEPGDVECSDITDVGRNPARLIPEYRAFVDKHAEQHVLLIGEALWPGRSLAETQEVTRHEALVNLAFAKADATIVCAYDVTRLPPGVIADARRTHPEWLAGGAPAGNGGAPPWQVPAGCDLPLPAAPPGAETLAYDIDLAPVRRLVEQHAEDTTLGADRAADLVLAASEVAANTLGHTTSGGTFQIWHDDAEIVCQARDQGWITDPLAGRVRHGPDGRGHGLYLVNHVCDLVEVRTGETGTTVRMHMRLPGADGSAPPFV